LKFHGTYQLLVYADDVNTLGGNVHNIKKNTEALVVPSKGIGIEVNTDKTKFTVISGDQNARRSYKLNFINFLLHGGSSEILGTTVTNQNTIQEEIKSRLKSGNACYHSVQNVLSSSLLFKNIKIKKYRTIIFPAVLNRRETRSLTLREERRLRVFRIGC
jgi:hypothetical protein